MEWLFIYKTHLYALFVIIGHNCDALMSDTDVGGDAIFYYTITFLDNLEDKDSILSSNVCPTTGNKSNVVYILKIAIHQSHILSHSNHKSALIRRKLLTGN